MLPYLTLSALLRQIKVPVASARLPLYLSRFAEANEPVTRPTLPKSA
jgi:hypothetical protein